MYTIKEMAELTHVSTRTLRYYDQIGLLKAHRKQDSEYRYYDSHHLDRLQQILIYRDMNVPLTQIKAILDDSNLDLTSTLQRHLDHLMNQQSQLTHQINCVKKQLGGTKMSVEARFEQYKKAQIENNNAQYGAELHSKYDTEELKDFETHYLNLDKTTFDNAKEAEQQLFSALKIMLQQELPIDSDEGRFIFKAHQSWLQAMAPHYSKAYHLQLATLYVEDTRFAQYYDDHAGDGAAILLSNIIQHYA
ncbi:MerR family transcriptional regulator [Staphylococcus ratti]|uniref:MerR family transcriptional regulator n=1 Tax=Staphylococcus ratti TaxID=2892440 RepID=A0ABY3PDK9_9STAP|nr:MerR family transcriptional regulator [Staphylococcus ratti]UEX90422.1 MerR family transcriptional regulator [Staphylococcus ratti]